MAESEAAERVEGRMQASARALDVPDLTLETARMLFAQVHDELDFEGRPADQLGAAALTIACRTDGLPVTVGDVVREWTRVADDATGEFDAKLVVRRLDLVSDVTGVAAPPADPIDLTRRYAEELELPAETAQTAEEILQTLMESVPHVLTRGTSPSGNAAAGLYLAARMHLGNQRVTQAEIGRVADVSEVTIRKRYQEMAEELEEHEVLSGSGVRGPAPEGDTDPSPADVGDEGADDADRTEGTDTVDGDTPDEGGDGADDGRTVEVSTSTYATLQAAADSRTEDEAALLVEATRQTLKDAIGGEEIRSPELGATTPVEVEFPRRVETVLNRVVDDDEYAPDSRGVVVSAAIEREFDGSAADEITSVELDGPVFRAAQRLVETSTEYSDVADLLRTGAQERVNES